MDSAQARGRESAKSLRYFIADGSPSTRILYLVHDGQDRHVLL